MKIHILPILFPAALCLLGTFAFPRLQAQKVIGGTTPDPSALLDVQSAAGGVLLPRMSTAEREAILQPATGLLLYNTTLNCMELNMGTQERPAWGCLLAGVEPDTIPQELQDLIESFPTVTELSLEEVLLPDGRTVQAFLDSLGAGNRGVQSTQLSYDNLGPMDALNMFIARLTLAASEFIFYDPPPIYDPPSVLKRDQSRLAYVWGGKNHLEPNAGVGNLCTEQVYGLDCSGLVSQMLMKAGVHKMTLDKSKFANAEYLAPKLREPKNIERLIRESIDPLKEIRFRRIPKEKFIDDTEKFQSGDFIYWYNPEKSVHIAVIYRVGGNNLKVVQSNGKSAEFSDLECDSNITKTNRGVRGFAANSKNLTSFGEWGILRPELRCGAFLAPGVWKAFMCHNLGADQSADPFTASWRLNGDYYQWGRATVAAAGPTGPSSGEANAGSITGWNTTAAANGAWSDATKTANDPCPTGFRVPTKAQWDAVINTSLNTRSYVGTNWASSSTNYTTGLRIGSGTSGLFLPAAGDRSNSNGSLGYRGFLGSYWSSTEGGSSAWNLYFLNGDAGADDGYRPGGMSVRCVAE
jgi:uncharacterized protein (TIGR02145 family)